MKFMLLIYSEPKALTEEERESCYAESLRLIDELRAKGQFVDASPLHPVDTAANVRVRDGRRFVTDGPYAETREHLGGYFVVEVDDQDEAVAIASRLPVARKGTIEVRRVLELAGLPVSLATS